MSLNKFVRDASRSAVIDGGKHIKKYYLPHKKLLAKTNQLDFNSQNAIKNHFDKKRSYSIPQTHLETFLAASSLVHSINGWSYLSRAINSLLEGDQYISIHLAYYSELRATIAFLASEGIGIFNRKHLAISKNRSIRKNPKNGFTTTHIFTWDILERWANPNISSDVELLKIFTVKGKNFLEWIDGFHSNASSVLSSKILKKWLTSWNFDVKSFRDDRNKRNEVTYRPKKFIEFDEKSNLREIITKLIDFWEAISPLLSDRFNLLDRYLLRMFFKTLHKEIEKLLGRSVDLEECVSDSMTKLGISDKQLKKFLCSESPFEDDHTIFLESEKQEITPLSIIARAILMLRVSIGTSSQIFKEADISKDDLKFYWEYIGVDNGFWKPQNSPKNFEDLWIDIEEYIDELDEWIKSNNSDLFNIFSNIPEELIYFSQFHRASLWGLRI